METILIKKNLFYKSANVHYLQKGSKRHLKEK